MLAGEEERARGELDLDRGARHRRAPGLGLAHLELALGQLQEQCCPPLVRDQQGARAARVARAQTHVLGSGAGVRHAQDQVLGIAAHGWSGGAALIDHHDAHAFLVHAGQAAGRARTDQLHTREANRVGPTRPQRQAPDGRGGQLEAAFEPCAIDTGHARNPVEALVQLQRAQPHTRARGDAAQALVQLRQEALHRAAAADVCAPPRHAPGEPAVAVAQILARVRDLAGERTPLRGALVEGRSSGLDGGTHERRTGSIWITSLSDPVR